MHCKATLIALLTMGLTLMVTALPLDTAETPEPEIRCPEATHCPTGYTCCGLFDVKLGGICRKLEQGQWCIF
ncbi:hypothetical protein DFP72DRAFT_885354 [Ephemerocybe angulata]|uniref:Uncharacterized protein n=1 Tax=Ephemerocybe angulata TaxID=980116 RepID=A0A8H6I824_9AGAR|nr:hypothetical protein DFP72DRAFT_885354 [Tulosesus angulatus]